MSNNFNLMEMLGCISREKANLTPRTVETKPNNHIFDRKNSILRPLTNQFFINLLDLEDQFLKKQVTTELITQMTQNYTVYIYLKK